MVVQSMATNHGGQVIIKGLGKMGTLFAPHEQCMGFGVVQWSQSHWWERHFLGLPQKAGISNDT